MPQRSADERGGAAAPLHWSTYALVCATLVGYAAMIGFLALKRGDQNWDRLVFLFSGLEAIVFAAAGLVFGGNVQRGALQTARQDAAGARAEAQAARAEAQDLGALEAAISLGAEAEQQRTIAGAERPEGALGARPSAPSATGWTLTELDRFARTLRDRRAG